MAQPAPLITLGIGPGGSILYALTLGLDIGAPPPEPVQVFLASALLSIGTGQGTLDINTGRGVIAIDARRAHMGVRT